MKELYENVKNLKNETYKKIMYRLINIYINECVFNEGDLGFTDLCEIYLLLKGEEDVKSKS